jgi:hypothetical protein
MGWASYGAGWGFDRRRFLLGSCGLDGGFDSGFSCGGTVCGSWGRIDDGILVTFHDGGKGVVAGDFILVGRVVMVGVGGGGGVVVVVVDRVRGRLRLLGDEARVSPCKGGRDESSSKHDGRGCTYLGGGLAATQASRPPNRHGGQRMGGRIKAGREG